MELNCFMLLKTVFENSFPNTFLTKNKNKNKNKKFYFCSKNKTLFAKQALNIMNFLLVLAMIKMITEANSLRYC
jgi:hypothetical protein